VIEKIKETLHGQGAAGALMSGSGPTVFGLFKDSGDADRAAANLSRHTAWQIYRAEILNGA
jgi:4-diphosphocytidyl-2-C-methyl-D-erythritol kinase